MAPGPAARSLQFPTGDSGPNTARPTTHRHRSLNVQTAAELVRPQTVGPCAASVSQSAARCPGPKVLRQKPGLEGTELQGSFTSPIRGRTSVAGARGGPRGTSSSPCRGAGYARAHEARLARVATAGGTQVLLTTPPLTPAGKTGCCTSGLKFSMMQAQRRVLSVHGLDGKSAKAMQDERV